MKKIDNRLLILILVLFSGFMATPKVDKDFIKSVKENAKEIKSLDSEDYSDLNFMKNAIGDKRIVFIGESSHYVQQYNALKLRLVKYLTREMGFNVLAFESPLSELSYYDEPNLYQPDSILKNGIFKMWHTDDNLALIKYLSQNKINLIGFDIQIHSYPMVLKYIRRELSKTIKSTTAEKFLKADSLFMLAKPDKSEMEQRNQIKINLIELYDVVLKELSEQKDKTDPLKFAVLERVIRTKKYLCSAYGENYTPSLRDSLMAENLTWIIKNIYKNEKVIVWAHNYHILKEYPEKVEMKQKLMGAELNDIVKNESYFIGLYCYKGNIIYNNKVNVIKTPHDNSLEAIIHTSGFKNTFIDFTSMPDNKMNSWIYKPIEALYSGYYIKDRIIPIKSYDGIIQIDSVSPSKTIDYTNNSK